MARRQGLGRGMHLERLRKIMRNLSQDRPQLDRDMKQAAPEKRSTLLPLHQHTLSVEIEQVFRETAYYLIP
jgi:hypothetical protein